MYRKTGILFRTDLSEKVGLMFQTLFAGGLSSVVFSQYNTGPRAWSISAHGFLFGCIGSTWYRDKRHAELDQLATEENVANQFLKLVKQLNPSNSAIKGERK